MTDGKDRNSLAEDKDAKFKSKGALPSYEAFRLLAVATGRPIAEVRSGVDMTATEQESFEALTRRRLAGEPLQYLEGSVPFAGVEIGVDPRVLIPRPETEYLVELIAKTETEPAIVLDLCTGSGALALALKERFPSARVIGTDVFPEALEVARENAAHNGLEVDWRLGDLFAALPPEIRGEVDLLVANPPYVAESEWPDLPIDVRQEPRQALVAGPVGTEIIERILRGLVQWMAPGSVAWIEIGETQGGDLANAFPISVHADQYGRARFVRWSSPVTRAQIVEAAGRLRAGDVIGMPTDTVYGVAADPGRPDAVAELFALKGRPESKALGLLVPDTDAALELVELPAYAMEWIRDHWPGPLNLVARARSLLPDGVGNSELGTVAVRVPNHHVALAMLRSFGPLAVTSANPSGGAETLNELEAETALGDAVSFYLPGTCPRAMASTTMDVTGAKPKLLRKGPLDLEI